MTLAVKTLASVVAFGLKSWIAIWKSLALTRTLAIEQGATGFEKMQSVFARVRLMRGDTQTAYAAQTVVILLTLAAVILLWRSRADRRAISAVTIMAALLTTPYCFDYDMVMLGPAIAFLTAQGVEKGFGPYEKSALVLVFAAQLVARAVAMLLPLPIGVMSMMLVFALTVYMARQPLACCFDSRNALNAKCLQNRTR